MGGKSQQTRMPKNAKPASSGQIRDLLASQQFDTRNVITFSALSESRPPHVQQQTAKPSKCHDERAQSAPEEIPAETVENNLPSGASLSPQHKEKVKLVARRVGDRVHYTRVKYEDPDEAAADPSDAGVKKPAFPLDRNSSSDSNFNHNISREYSMPLFVEEPLKKSPFNTLVLESKLLEEPKDPAPPEPQYDFDSILTELEDVQDQIKGSHYDSLGELSDSNLKAESDLIRLLEILVTKFVTELSIEDWDLVVKSIYKWIGWIAPTDNVLREPEKMNFAVKVFDLIYELSKLADSLKKDEHKPEEFPMLQSLVDDWNNFHSSNLFQDILGLYFKLVSLEVSCDDQAYLRPLIETLAQLVVNVDSKMALSHYSLVDNLEAKIEVDPDFQVPDRSIYFQIDANKYKGFIATSGLLRSNSRVIALTAHRMLRSVMDRICEDAHIIETEEQDYLDEVPVFPPLVLMSILTTRDSMMTALLGDFKVGDDSVYVDPNTDSYSCTLSYLFVWDLVIQFIVGVDKAIGHRIIHQFKKLGLIQRLLDNIFMLLPPLGEKDSLNLKFDADDKYSRTHCRSWCLSSYLKSPLYSTVKRPYNEIELVALHLYFSVASHMPVTVRKWFNNNPNKRLCNLVQEYTIKHISQVICSLEMESVQEECRERANRDGSKNLVIKARPSAKEVYATYNRDEFKMELTIKLPVDYPLGPVQVDGGKRVGVTDVKWRSWLLQLTTFLSHQNGPILDGIDLWRKNIDKRFEGVEKCTICFSILHSNYQLPKKKCQTCANTFHNLCLYKWFESSGNSTCPLCRNPW